MKMENLKAQFQVIIDGFTMLGTLVGGRIGIPSALAAAKSGLTIAINIATSADNLEGSEVPILNYRIHQRRLLPLLAKHMQSILLQYVTNRFIDKRNLKCRKLKPCCGYEGLLYLGTTAVLQECREAIGGKDLSENRIDALK
jgi:acyl-CoA oxidase